jgi:monoamine oxidase
MKKKSVKGNALSALQKAFAYSAKAEHHATQDAVALYGEQQQQPYNRRKFLADVSKASLAFAAAGLYQSCNSFNEKTQPAIAIVGAGIAGLHAAYILKNAGYNATVYEAAHRCGGRILSVADIMGPGLWTEMGGEFIDSTHEDMLNLCKKFNLPLLDREPDLDAGLKEFAYYFNGRQYGFQDVLKEMQPFRTQMIKDVNSLSKEISFEKFTAADKHFDELSITAYLDGLGVKGWFKNMFEMAYLAEIGLDAEDQSSINMLGIFNPSNQNKNELFGSSDERYSVIGGNDKITTALQKELKEQIQFDHYLTAVSQNNSKQYLLTFKTPGGTLKDIKADIIIMTVPFSVLREVDFKLPLPEWKMNAIKKLGYGQSSKLFIGVNERIWRQQGYAGYCFTDTGLQNGYDHTQMQSNNKGPGGFTINLGGKLSIDSVNKETNVLQDEYVALFDQVFPGAAKVFNGRFQRWHWPSFALSKGSYTGFTTGQYTTISGATVKPVDNLFFAGEHCSYEFQGFMNGAAKTGRLAAETIIEKLKKR